MRVITQMGMGGGEVIPSDAAMERWDDWIPA